MQPTFLYLLSIFPLRFSRYVIDEPAKIAKLFLFPFLSFVSCTQDVSDAWQRQEPTLLRVLRNSPCAMPPPDQQIAT